MACKVRYLNSAGIMPREIKGIDALSKAFPPNWLLYVSLNCFPRNQSPMEIDAVVVMDDLILLLEIKDWNGKLTYKGDRWFVNGAPRKRSAVVLVDEKAKKLKSVIQGQSSLAGAFYVDSRVVFTGTANAANLQPQEQARCLTLSEAMAIGDPAKRHLYVKRGKVSLTKACSLEAEFDRIFNNTQLFQRLEADWAGYTVTEKDIFVHPKQVWRDHLAERSEEKRLKAMVRTWSFNNLPVGLNSSEMRKLVAMRETNAFAYLQDVGSELISRQRVLREIATPDEEVSTGHFEVRQIAPGWYPLDQYIVRNTDALSVLDRITIVMSLLSIVAELHRVNVTHRDLGPRSIWVGGHSDLALTGFMSCQLPDKTTVMDWLKDLRGYAGFLPEDVSGCPSTGRQRDVYSCAYLATQVLTGEVPKTADIEATVAALPPELKNLGDWVRRGLSVDPLSRYASAAELTDAFAVVVEAGPADGFDQSLLDRFETTDVPYVRWPLSAVVSSSSQKQVYEHINGAATVMVKVWMSWLRGRSTQSDCALLKLLLSVDQLIDAPLKGLPRFLARGLSPLGAFVVYERSEGTPLAGLKSLPENTGLELAADLLRTVTSLHERSCEHGDISPSNVLVNVDDRTICLIDPFDISQVGDGASRTPSMLPDNWELLPQAAIDRFAALKAVQMLLVLDPSSAAGALQSELDAELKKPVIESLQYALTKVSQAVEALTAAEVIEFHLKTEGPTHGFSQTDKLYVRRRIEQSGAVAFDLTTEKAQLVLKGTGIELQQYYFRQTFFATLERESRSAHSDLPIRVAVQEGGIGGFDELYAYLCSHERFTVLPAEEDRSAPPTQFEVTWHWTKLLEIEEESRVEIAVTEILAQKGQALVLAYENLGRDFDFDEDDSIDVFVGNRKIGYVDLSASSFPSAIGIVCERGNISNGDHLRLAERREQTSMERRSRAVRRILDRRSVIGDLVEYFDPHKSVPPKSFDLSIDDAQLAAYGLNAGQQHAFRHLLSSGPVGLLQGPPGTGKTRFIASFVHWLISKGGGQRVLIASQSHEAVNNAIESLLRLHKGRGETRPSLLRIGSKGITDRIRPFHTSELRESYRVKFDAAAKNRFGQLTKALGVDRTFASELFDLDKQIGTLARRLSTVQEALDDDEGQLAVDRERNRVQRARVQDAFVAAFKAVAGQETDGVSPLQAYDHLVNALHLKHPNVSPADASAAQRALKLTNDWLASLGSPGRNFEEFLAKTRSVVSATCVGVGQTRIKIETQVFDWVIVDEAARCTPGELAVPIQMAKRVLLVGDHLQLLPMMDEQMLSDLREVEPDVSVEELARSDFERAFTSTYGQSVGVRLTEQYRMDSAICDLVSECFYEESGIRLVTSAARKSALQPTDFGVPWLSKPLVWIDASNEHMNSEYRPEGETTIHNRSEVDAIIAVLETLAADSALVTALAKVDDETPIGVICMYAGQKRQIELAWSRRPFDPKFKRLVRIDTVDSYQGKENAIVILSLVRSNPKGSPGHVGISNRCNVAVSRAQERLIVVGDAEMWERRVDPKSPMRRVFEHMKSNPDHATFLKASEVA
ncbi:AAA domain-containing protein [Burkholderia cenocepacia]|uniref:AAA domain-containing protein n=1 Tax=Burkholderia cenocepacia TaxID=95486 RepID=UPI002862577F|nr:AAA domain-containing protein [Burkholderia cenocepacia]MDR8037960.1 AAA family ATPase [Burkholderia cenocepacia]